MWERQFHRIFATLSLAACVGCTHWSSTNKDYSLFDPPRMSPDSVVLEIAILDLQGDTTDTADQLWQEVDEQHLEADVRRQLATHGLRSGVLGTHVPDWICRGLIAQNRQLQLDESKAMAMPSDIVVQRRLQCRAGKQRQVPIGAPFEKLAVTGKSDESIEYSKGQCLLAVTVSPQGDGRVNLELTPEIHYGEPKQHWVGQGGYFRSDVALERASFDEMTISATLHPGQTVVLAAHPEADRLGRVVCQSETGKVPPGRLVLLRLAQTQSDDLFAPHKSLEPIATLTE